MLLSEKVRSRSKYFFADPNVIVTPPDKEITLPSEDVSFELSTSQLDKLLKAAAIYQLPDLSVVGGDGVVKFLFVIRRMIPQMIFLLLLERLNLNSHLILKLRILRFFWYI